jgi:hypothetical protein
MKKNVMATSVSHAKNTKRMATATNMNQEKNTQKRQWR